MTTRPFTVVLMRSYRFSELPEWGNEPETDTYIAHVDADGYKAAIVAAKQQVYEADQRDLGQGNIKAGRKFMDRMELGLDEYQFLVLFEGHIQPMLHGWQE